MNIISKHIRWFIASSLVCAFGSELSLAQNGRTSENQGPVIEEVIVSAQRKSQQIQDVPISMSAFGSEFLAEQGITDLQDIAAYVPNVRMDIAGTFIEPRVRGFATNTVVNRGLELPVGIVVDDVPYSRGDYFAAGLFDISRVEVLRGPQGQLFGANTTVGLINLVTERPSEEFTGSIALSSGENGRERYELALGGPIFPGMLHFRVAAVSENFDDYVENTTYDVTTYSDKGLGGRERDSFRVKLDFPNLFGGSYLFAYQRDDNDFNGTPRELAFVPEHGQDYMRSYDPNLDFEEANLRTSTDGPSHRVTDIETVTASANYDIGEWALHLVGGWSYLESSSRDDADAAPWPVLDTFTNEASRQRTLEVRFDSPNLDGLFGLGSLFGIGLGSSEFTAGVFMQRKEQVPTTTTQRLNVPLLGILTAMGSDPNFPNPLIQPPDKWEFFFADFHQQAKEKAVFAQASWQLTSRFALIAGVRLSEIEKRARWFQDLGSENGPCCLLDQLISRFNGDEENIQRHTAPKIGFKFDLSDDINFYLTWAEGFQAGGFNNFSNSDSLEARTVDPSTVKSWEAGSKMRLLNGSAELNLGLFWMTMTDFQQFTVADINEGDILPTAQVTNVGEIRARGAEADATWLVNHWLSLRASVGFNDSEYIEYPIGTCFSDNPNRDGDDEPRCDLAGQPMAQVPKWEVGFSPGIQYDLGTGSQSKSFLDRLTLTAALNVQYTAKRFLSETNDPRTEEPAFVLYGASVGIRDDSAGWSFQIRGENLGDERYNTTAYEQPPFSGVGGKTPGPPRTLVGNFRWEF